jgi:recombination protein RecT
MNAESTEVVEATGKSLAPYQSAIAKAKEKFTQVCDNLVNYDKESIFAMQALMKTDYAMQVANKNPQSVRLAMINVASTGLTLNPAHAYAYLVPRDGAIVLDISYKGLIKIATDAGAIMWARADLVYEQDSFTYHGPAKLPDHVADPFKKDRGELIGAYCIAKTRDGDVLVEVMARDEIEKIRGKSDLYAKRKSGPWVEWFAQMVKKAVIKRASKTWPYTGRSGRLFDAIELANASEGGYTLDDDAPAATGRELPAGRPQDGMRMEDMPYDRRPELLKLAAEISALADAGKVAEAYALYMDEPLENEERIAVFGSLKSYHRTSFKRLQSTPRREAEGAQE